MADDIEPRRLAGRIGLFPGAKIPAVLRHRDAGRACAAEPFGTPAPSTQQMSRQELIRFFEAQRKGAPLRLTLKKGKVFSGKMTSYDSINETVWFETPWQGLFNTASFGVDIIRYAEPVGEEVPAASPAPLINRCLVWRVCLVFAPTRMYDQDRWAP